MKKSFADKHRPHGNLRFCPGCEKDKELAGSKLCKECWTKEYRARRLREAHRRSLPYYLKTEGK